MTASDQLELPFARAADLADVARGAILYVPAGADRVRPRAYRLEVMQAGAVEDGGTSVHVRGRAPRSQGSIGRRQPFWATLRLDLIRVEQAAPQKSAPAAPAGPSAAGEPRTGHISLPLMGPGGWSITSWPCPACEAVCVVVAQLGDDAEDPRWECRACDATGAVVEAAECPPSAR